MTTSSILRSPMGTMLLTLILCARVPGAEATDSLQAVQAYAGESFAEVLRLESDARTTGEVWKVLFVGELKRRNGRLVREDDILAPVQQSLNLAGDLLRRVNGIRAQPGQDPASRQEQIRAAAEIGTEAILERWRLRQETARTTVELIAQRYEESVAAEVARQGATPAGRAAAARHEAEARATAESQFKRARDALATARAESLARLDVWVAIARRSGRKDIEAHLVTVIDDQLNTSPAGSATPPTLLDRFLATQTLSRAAGFASDPDAPALSMTGSMAPIALTNVGVPRPAPVIRFVRAGPLPDIFEAASDLSFGRPYHVEVTFAEPGGPDEREIVVEWTSNRSGRRMIVNVVRQSERLFRSDPLLFWPTDLNPR